MASMSKSPKRARVSETRVRQAHSVLKLPLTTDDEVSLGAEEEFAVPCVSNLMSEPAEEEGAVKQAGPIRSEQA